MQEEYGKEKRRAIKQSARSAAVVSSLYFFYSRDKASHTAHAAYTHCYNQKCNKLQGGKHKGRMGNFCTVLYIKLENSVTIAREDSAFFCDWWGIQANYSIVCFITVRGYFD